MTDASKQNVSMLTIDEPVDREASWVAVTSPGDALRRVHATKPQAVLVRIDSLGAADGSLEVLEALHRRWPRVVLIVVSSRHDDRIERSMRAAGATCYVHGEIDLMRIGDLLAGIGARPSCRDPTGRPNDPRATGPPGRFRAGPAPSGWCGN